MTPIKRRLSIGVVALFLSVFTIQKAKGEAFSLSTLDTSTVEPVLTTLASSFAFRPMEGATVLGTKWGAYLGLGVSATSTTSISSAISNLSTAYLPGAEAHLGIGLPYGITLELGILPSFSYSGTSISKTAGALKWTVNSRFFKKFPIQIAARLLYGSGGLSYTQTDASGSSTVDFSTSQLGGNLVFSRYVGLSMLGFEPYVGIGALNQSSSISASGTAVVFGSSFPLGTTSVSSSGLSLWYQAGLLLKLGIFGFTAEYGNAYGIGSYGGKVTIRM